MAALQRLAAHLRFRTWGLKTFSQNTLNISLCVSASQRTISNMDKPPSVQRLFTTTDFISKYSRPQNRAETITPGDEADIHSVSYTSDHCKLWLPHANVCLQPLFEALSKGMIEIRIHSVLLQNVGSISYLDNKHPLIGITSSYFKQKSRESVLDKVSWGASCRAEI